MVRSEKQNTFTLKEIVEIFRMEAQQITDNTKEASNYATNAVKDFQSIYQGRIR